MKQARSLATHNQPIRVLEPSLLAVLSKEIENPPAQDCHEIEISLLALQVARMFLVPMELCL
ncbi:MAG: hypothetical protein H5T41_06395 [Methanomassiliicoccales archaeon]|nr:hypothetical protein [Methanomassiliicoccales archaeon]